MIDYKTNKTKIDRSARKYITKNYPIAINGITYRLKNIRKRKAFVYDAILEKNDIEPKEIFKNKNGVLIDHLLDVELNNYDNTEIIKLNKLVNNNKIINSNRLLYFNFYNDLDRSHVKFFIESPKLNQLGKSFPNLYIINIGILKNNEVFDRYVNEFHINKKELLIVVYNDYDKLFKLGYNHNFSNGILFDNKGKVILSNISSANLKQYLYQKRKENIEKNKH